jgi:hypothetical protein
MKKPLIQKKEAAIEALREVHADTSGPASDNLEAIREIISEAQEIETGLKFDCEKSQK